MKRVTRRLLVVVLALVVLLGAGAGVLWLMLPRLTLRYVNARIGTLFTAPAEVGAIEVHPLRGEALLFDVTVGQPPGFGTNRLVTIERAHLAVDLASIHKPVFAIRNLTIDSMRLSLIRQTNGGFNVAALRSPSTTTNALLQAVAIRRLDVRRSEIIYASDAYTEPLRIPLTEVACEAHDLWLALGKTPVATNAPPGRATITARVPQTGYAQGYAGVATVVGPIGATPPTLNAVCRFVGMDLRPVAAIVPRGAPQALGGDAFDLSADVAMRPDLLDARLSTYASGGQRLAMEISGTPQHPVFDKSDLLFIVLSRFGGGFGDLANNLLGAGGEVVRTAMAIPASVLEGLGHAAKQAGRGVADTARSTVRGQGGGMASGVGEIFGAVTGMAKSAAKTTGGAVKGIVEAGDAASGGEQADRWRAAIPVRWTNTWPAANEYLNRLPYPPDKLPGKAEEKNRP